LQGTPTLGQSRTSPPKPNVVFPGLQLLALEAAIFESDDDEESACVTVDSLLDHLKQRHMHGAQLHELHLQNCYYLYLEEVDLFKEFVGSVHWDELEQEVSEEEDDNEDDEDEVDFDNGYDSFEHDSDVDPYEWDY
jgi:hypothetical protein